MILVAGGSTVGWLLNNNPAREDTSTLPTLTPTPETTLQIPQPETPEQPPAESLNANYSQLETLLQDEKWEEADRETYRVMLEVSRREGLVEERQDLEWLSFESISNFSCPDLKKIDQLWRTYSDNHFGFSIQKRIWLEMGGRTDEETLEKLRERLDWQKTWSAVSQQPILSYYEGIRFDVESPEGHLPIPPNLQIIDNTSTTRHVPFLVFPLAQRVAVCDI